MLQSVDWTQVIANLGGEVIPSQTRILIQGLNRSDAIQVCQEYFSEIMAMTQNWGAESTQILPSEGNPIELTSDLPTQINSEPRQTLWVGVCEIDPILVGLMGEVLDNPQQGAVIQLATEKQIIVFDPEGGFYPTPDQAVQCARSQYWDMADLEIMRQRTRQESEFEMIYLADDEPGANDWSRIRTRFTVFQDSKGRYYHKCRVLEYEELGARTLEKHS